MSAASVHAVLRTSRELRVAGKFRDAIELLTEALKDHPDARLYFARGIAHDLLDQPTLAVADLTRAIELDPTEAKYYYHRGCILSHHLQGDDQAIPDFQKVLELDPNNVNAHRECCLCLLVIGRPNRALEHATVALLLAPEEGLTLFCLGQSRFSLKQYDRAIEAFTRAVELHPDYPHYWASLGHARKNAGSRADLESALDAYSQAIQLSPDSASYFLARGGVRLRLGRLDEAVTDLRHALALNPDEATLMLITHSLAHVDTLSRMDSR